jgi:tRNA-2-methylthio-N6-dimethylallyladenosine synthase
LSILNKLVREHAKENNQKWLNMTIDVLVEGMSKTDKKVWFGYSPQWKVVNFIGESKVGEIAKIKINKASRFSLFGEKIN